MYLVTSLFLTAATALAQQIPTLSYQQWLSEDCKGRGIVSAKAYNGYCVGVENWPAKSIKLTAIVPCSSGKSLHLEVSEDVCDKTNAVTKTFKVAGECITVDFAPQALRGRCL